jgi:hypothetical protein
MSGSDSTQTLLARRKLTRAIGDAMRGQMADYLAVLTPQLRPSAVLGEYMHGGQREPNRKAERAYKELQALYESAATVAPFNLPRELKPPFNLGVANLEITPVDYDHVATAGSASRSITVRSPLSWVLCYSGFAPARMREVLSSKLRSNEELQKMVLSYLIMHVVLNEQPGVKQILHALRFPITTSKMPEFGTLPVTKIGLAVSTSRPSDDVLLQSAELTGVDAFEEVVDVDDVQHFADPLKEQLVALAREHAPGLVRA